MKALVCTLAAALLVSGCSAGNSSSGTDSRDAAPRKGASAPGRAPAKVQNAKLAPAQAIIYSADLTVRAADVTGASARAKQLVAAAGGYVGDENTVNEPGTPAAANITFKVPADRYAAVLDQLGSSRIGRRLSQRQRAQDVTQDVADVNQRVASAKASLASFRGLLNQATDMNQIIELEQELETRQADLESLQARQRSLTNETAYATISVRITAPEQRPAATGGHGLGGALASGWHAFTTFLRGIAVVIAVLLPFLALATVLGLPTLWLVRRRRRSPAGAVGSGE